MHVINAFTQLYVCEHEHRTLYCTVLLCTKEIIIRYNYSINRIIA